MSRGAAENAECHGFSAQISAAPLLRVISSALWRTNHPFDCPFANTPHAPLNYQIEPPCGPLTGPRNLCRPIMLPQDSGVDY